MRYIIATLGCKVNQYESEAMDLLLRKDGHTPCLPSEQADVILINSCAVTSEGARKVRQTARRLKKAHPNALLAICGCWSQIEPENAAALGSDVLFGTGHRADFVAAVEKAAAGRSYPVRSIDNPFAREIFEDLPSGAYAGHARAYLKIEDGCDNFCTYCIIPYARGRVLSLSAERCAAASVSLAAQGFKEIVITGIEISSWGKDLKNGQSLIDCIEIIGAATPEVRLHLGSLEPTVVTEDFVERLKNVNVCPHFHLSMQSGCDATLKRMRRKYDTAQYFRCVQLLRSAFPGCSITTDLICGFPGETEEEFSATLSFLRKCSFSSMHIFPYSVREGTKAAAMSGQIPQSTKECRTALAREVAAELQQSYLSECIGKEFSVLFETEKNGLSTGHSENYVEVSVPGHGLRGQVLPVCITAVEGSFLRGELVPCPYKINQKEASV